MGTICDYVLHDMHVVWETKYSTGTVGAKQVEVLPTLFNLPTVGRNSTPKCGVGMRERKDTDNERK